MQNTVMPFASPLFSEGKYELQVSTEGFLHCSLAVGMDML